MEKKILKELQELNTKIDKLLELDKMLLKAEAAAGIQDGFPVRIENETCGRPVYPVGPAIFLLLLRQGQI